MEDKQGRTSEQGQASPLSPPPTGTVPSTNVTPVPPIAGQGTTTPSGNETTCNLAPVNKFTRNEKVMMWLTGVIAFGTLVSAVAIGFQWYELHEGGFDTAAIAKAAKQQACAAQKSAQAARDFADSAANINVGITDAVKELNRQAKEAELSRRTSSEASQKTLDATISNFHRDQRAWVGITKIEGTLKLNEGFNPTAYFMNSGRTPAIHVTTFMQVIPGVIGNEPDIPVPDSDGRGSINQFMPGVPYENSVRMSKEHREIIESVPFLTDLDAGYRTIYIIGRFDYTDTFGSPHWTTFCHFFTKFHSWVACNQHNESDENGR